jgi:hypothetical protein
MKTRTGDYPHREWPGILGVDFHHFIEKEAASSRLELSREFGISLGEVRRLQKEMAKR